MADITPEYEASEWLDAMIDNLAEADVDWSRRENAVAIIEEYIRWHVQQSVFTADVARNAAIKEINASGGLVTFLSPDTGTRCLTSASHLQQMLQVRTVDEALNATDGIVVY